MRGIARAGSVITAAIVVGLGAPGASALQPEYCTNGDAKALLQSLVVVTSVIRTHSDSARLATSFANCQYRLYFDGATYTFSENDVFLGGIVWIWDYKAAGISRSEAIADIELNEDRVWLTEVLPDGELGEPVEQTLEHTGYKDMISPIFGQIVSQHRAFITQLPQGEYLSTWESTHPDFGLTTATVTLIIEP